MIPNDYGIPITKNCVFALRLDFRKKTEEILIGELNEVKRRLIGFPHGAMLYEKTRDIGRLVMDYEPAAIVLADIRATLLDSIGKKKSPFFGYAVNRLIELYSSDNPLYRFTALLMWQEYHSALRRDKKANENLLDMFDDVTLALRFNLIDIVKGWQEQKRGDPLSYLDTDYRKYPILLYYGGGKDTPEYAVADCSLLSIAVYYLKRVYDSRRYIQTCPVCGNSFVAKTAGMTTLCSDDCRRVQGKESKRRFDERSRELSYERAYKNTYMYWYNKVKKCRGLDLPETKLGKIEAAFNSFSRESAARKKEAANGKADVSEYESWLLTQRDAIDNLLAELKL